MIDFPDWSDLGGVSSPQSNTWQNELARRAEYRAYFDGEVFKRTVPLEAGMDEAAPLLYPVGINLVKLLALAQADSLFGEWEDDIIRFQARQDTPETADVLAAIELCSLILVANEAETLLLEGAIDREVYGGTAYKIAPEIGLPGHIRLSRLNLDDFFPVWDPDNAEDLLECWIKTTMTKEQAKAKYGFEGKGDVVVRVEHWTRRNFENRIDGSRISAYSGVNPWGVVPIVYIPRLRTSSWWGDALTPDVMTAQDELNMRVADLGDAINYNTHPIRWGMNLPRGFNAANFPLGPQAFWDLGRTIGNATAPEVGLLEAKNPVPEHSLEFINFVYDWARTSAFAPPIAFGEDDGGGQRSGKTLEIRMWPLIRATRRSRAYMGAGLRRVFWIAAQILAQKALPDVSASALKCIQDGVVVPSFFPMMPRDQQALVDEVTKLWTIQPPQLSMDTTQKILGRGPAEVNRILKMLGDPKLKDYFEKQEPEAPPSSGAGKGGDPPKKDAQKKEEQA